MRSKWWMALALVGLLVLVGCGKNGLGGGPGDDDDDDDDSTKFDPDPPGPCALALETERAPAHAPGWVVVHHCELGSCGGGNKQNDLWIAAIDGSEVRQLTTTAAEDGFIDNRFLDFTTDDAILYKSLAVQQATEWELRQVTLDGTDTLLASNVTDYLGQTATGTILFARGLGPSHTTSPDRDLFAHSGGTETPLAATPNADEQLIHLLDSGELIYSDGAGAPDGSGALFGDLYVVRADGTGTVQLSNEPGREDFAGVTPSGRVVYTNLQNPGAGADPLADIYSVRLDGTDKIALASAVDQEIAAGVADETVVVQYITLVPGQDPNVKFPAYDLYRIEADGTGQGVIANDDTVNETFNQITPWCSAIYSEIRFEQQGQDTIALTRMFAAPLPTAGASPILLDDIGDGGYSVFYASNGKKIYYTRAGQDVYVINEDGTEQIQLSTNPETEAIVDLVLYQKRAIYKRVGGSGDTFHSVGIDGSGDTAIAPELAGTQMYFGRAGNHLVLTHAEQGSANSDVFSVPAAGGPAVLLADDDDLEVPAFQLSDGRVLYNQYRGTFGMDLFVVPADGSSEPVPLIEESGDDRFAGWLP